ncbi:MAG TPA: hypothetical protein VJ397_03915 [Thermoplasmata archaeon]|nr:hypothetical protein [Thermoplasmata archaeon]
MPGEIAERLMELPEASAVSLRMKTEHYFDVVRAILDVFAPKKNLDSFYITCTIPSASIINALQVLEIPVDHIWFVDCISQTMMSTSQRHPHAIYVESPTMLENLMLKVEYLIRHSQEQRNDLIILDSINSLSIHNNMKILNEFLHIFVNNLRSKNAYTIVFSMEEYETDEVRNIMNLVCDQTITVKGD